MSQALVLFTLEYPDPLLDKEIGALAKEFDAIYLLPGKVLGPSKLPVNVEVFSIFKPVQLNKPGVILLRHIPMTLRLYWWALFKSGYRKYYIKYFKSFLGHLLIEAEKIKPLRQFIEEKGLQGALFYDYWLVDSTLALAELKRKGIIQFSVSRAHGFDLYHERQFEERVSYQGYRIESLDAVFTISRHGHDYLINRVPSRMKSQVKLSYLGVNNFFQGELPKKNASQFTIASCSNLIPLKRIELLMEGLRLSKLDIRWIHFGDGPLRDFLEEKAKSLPGNIRPEFKGKVENEKVLEFYQHHFVDLFVSVSGTEGLPVSMMEAGSYGIPILACGVNGVPEIVSSETGVLLEKDIDPQQICDALEHTLLHKGFDRESIRRYCFKKFNADENYRLFIKELKKLAGMEMKEKESPDQYRQCTRCVLDTRDSPTIEFDEEGICNYCRKYEQDERKFVKRGKEGEAELAEIVKEIKLSGKGNAYDSLLGISGGVDSTYLALQAKKLGLRPLLVHFDNGWNSELAVDNIEKTISKLGFDLHTLVIQWEEFRDLQLAFLSASVVDIEMVTDHAILATLYKLAVKHNIKYILSGTNIVTEGILPLNWIHHKADHIHIQAIQKRFVGKPLQTYPLLTVRLRNMAQLKGIQSISILNYIPYHKEKAKEELKQELGWRDYGGKHYESVFTRFYQGYILPTKFHIDKRKAHLSNLICSGQISRDEALQELSRKLYDERALQQDYDFVIKKLGLTREQFEAIMNTPPRPHTDYPVEKEIYERIPIFKLVRPFWRFVKKNLLKEKRM